MRPRWQVEANQLQLLQVYFDQILNPGHPFVVLAKNSEWPRFDAAFADCYRV